MPGIQFSFPLTDCTAPVSFTAWGRLDPQDADTTVMTHQCTMTRNGVATTAPLFVRLDGVWTSPFFNLAPGTNYSATAYYINKLGAQVPTNAAETGIEVTNQPVAVPLPPPYQPPPPFPLPIGALGGAGAVAGAVAAAAGAGAPAVAPAGTIDSTVLCGHPAIIPVNGIYPSCLKFHKAVAFVRQLASPRRVASVLPVLTSFGTWSVLVPEPPDRAAGVVYIVVVVWLDRNGIQVTQTVLLL